MAIDPSRPQTYENHRVFPTLTALSGFALLVNLGFAVWDLYPTATWTDAWHIAFASGLLALWWDMRRSLVVLQDRIIRMEMAVRLERVLGSMRRADIARLTLSQLIGLRFASDAELPELVDATLAGKLVAREDIKRSVKSWQADWLRV